jgi:hypothetical protein
LLAIVDTIELPAFLKLIQSRLWAGGFDLDILQRLAVNELVRSGEGGEFPANFPAKQSLPVAGYWMCR